MTFRVLYYATLLMFLFGALVFWVPSVLARTVPAQDTFIWGVVGISFMCLLVSIFAINTTMKERFVAYMSLLMSAITIVMFIISFFGHGVLPTRGIL